MSESFDYRRTNYVKAIEPWIEKPMVKVLTGMRRVGKSYLLREVERMLKERGVKPEQIITLNMELLEFDDIKTYKDLVKHVETQKKGRRKKRYLLIDEVQEIEHWERAINGWFSEGNWDIYLTGSNAHMLSSELATLLSGRYIEIPVYALSLKEYLQFRKQPQELAAAQELFPEYLRYGGLPAIHQFDLQPETVTQYVGSVFDTIVLKDIVQRHSIRNVSLFQNICRFAFDNVGSLLSAKKIADYLKSQRLKVSVDTVQSYLGYLEEAFVLHKVRRFDVRGKRHLEINEKYYLSDIGLRTAQLGHQPSAINGLLENLVYLELKRRGYEVSVGKVGELEIDFIAERRDTREYIQVCYLLADDKVVQREFGSLQAVDDNHPKMVLSMDTLWEGQMEGIGRINVVQWLLGE